MSEDVYFLSRRWLVERNDDQIVEILVDLPGYGWETLLDIDILLDIAIATIVKSGARQEIACNADQVKAVRRSPVGPAVDMDRERMSLVDRALVFATAAHAEVGQRRKYTGEPYIVHPLEVMTLVREHGGTEAMQAAALLHDVVEDTNVLREEISRAFGAEVAQLVDDLTEPEREGNRAARKAIECERFATISPDAQTIKCADLICNSRSIIAGDPGFAKIYLREKKAVLGVLTQANPELHRLAAAFVTDID
jgi:(p)ppGpp synthase/HD superfamily hydrolase